MVRGWLAPPIPGEGEGSASSSHRGALAPASRRGRQPGLALDVADGQQDGTRGNLSGLFGNEGPRQQRPLAPQMAAVEFVNYSRLLLDFKNLK